MRDKIGSDLSRSKKIRKEQKMIEKDMPVDIVCRVLNISPEQIQFLRQKGGIH